MVADDPDAMVPEFRMAVTTAGGIAHRCRGAGDDVA
jgi:hypothetical protein